jgi:hypothetical protein
MKKLPHDVINGFIFWRWFYAGDGCLTMNSKKEYFDKLLDLKDEDSLSRSHSRLFEDLPTSQRCLTAQELSMG